jgi:hypothetical protein
MKRPGLTWTVVITAWLSTIVWLLALSATARAATGASWEYAPAQAPPPPAGVAPSPFPTNVGTVGDIEFWAPDEGLLITGGTNFVPAGLYAYDGVSWHQLSTVCGSAEGRIAFASQDEWWTISDQRPGLALAVSGGSYLYDAVSLCHFVNGQVVGSYALPVDQTDSYPQMDAAACAGPDDCWFAGGFSGTTGGAFHLYWNGQALTEVDNTDEAHAVASMAVDGSQIYEGVTIAPTDVYSPSENPNAPALIHSIVTDDQADPFHDVLLADNACSGFCPTLPEYGTTSSGAAVTPDELSGFQLSSDGGESGDPATPAQVWALATPATESSPAHPLVLRYTNSDDSWNQIVGAPDLSWPAGQAPAAIAAVPGQNAAWVTLQDDGSNTAEVEQLSSGDGGTSWSVGSEQHLGPDQGVGDLGAAGPITCPAANDCWLATSQGWLFHYTDGTQLSQSSDPVFNGGIGVITYRPPDDGVPNVPGLSQPVDDSLANQAPPVQLAPVPGRRRKARPGPVATDEKVELIRGTDTIDVAFKLSATARVQLVASRRVAVRAAKAGKRRTPRKSATRLVVVARSRVQILRKGKHSIRLTLDPKRWPTSLKLNAARLESAPKKTAKARFR